MLLLLFCVTYLLLIVIFKLKDNLTELDKVEVSDTSMVVYLSEVRYKIFLRLSSQFFNSVERSNLKACRLFLIGPRLYGETMSHVDGSPAHPSFLGRASFSYIFLQHVINFLREKKGWHVYKGDALRRVRHPPIRANSSPYKHFGSSSRVNSVKARPSDHARTCKGIRILEYGKCFVCGIWNPGLWTPEYTSRNAESHWQRLESSTWNLESKAVSYSLTSGKLLTQARGQHFSHLNPRLSWIRWKGDPTTRDRFSSYKRSLRSDDTRRRQRERQKRNRIKKENNSARA